MSCASCGQGRGGAEARQVRHDDAQGAEVGDDGLEAVVVAAQPVQEHDGVRRVGWAVGPAGGAAAAEGELVAADRQALHERGVGGAVGHRRECRSGAAAQRVVPAHTGWCPRTPQGGYAHRRAATTHTAGRPRTP